MKYFYDTEFIEDGKTIDLISIGIVAEDDRELYVISNFFDESRASEWVAENVLRKLPPVLEVRRFNRRQMANAVENFISERDRADVELWADYGAYDHVALCQLYGTMMDVPRNIPMFTNDFQQLWNKSGQPTLPDQADGVHDALQDARHLKRCYDAAVS